jgi:hypothetical protein
MDGFMRSRPIVVRLCRWSDQDFLDDLIGTTVNLDTPFSRDRRFELVDGTQRVSICREHPVMPMWAMVLSSSIVLVHCM